MPRTIRPATKIVATIGPATSSETMIRALIEAGVDVFRLNFSHSDPEMHASVAKSIRKISSLLDIPVAILQDLQGPKIRVGEFEGGGPITLSAGDRITLTSKPVVGNAKLVPTTYEHIAEDTKPGDIILLDDGNLELRVLDSKDTDVLCEVVRGGFLYEHKGINLPGVPLSTPALTEKDIQDLKIGRELEVDYVALSFVRKPSDVELAKKILRDLDSDAPVISKLEKPEAIANLDDILCVSDGVMVARGDLGVEMPPERVPIIQKQVIRKCQERGLPAITATQMLESMISSPRPTRAEASDVANAILDGTDAVMLSGETAVGKYPVEAVRMMRRIAMETEKSIPTRKTESFTNMNPVRALSDAACSMAEDLPEVCAVVPMTRSGYTAQIMSSTRVSVPILAYTYSEKVRRRLALWWGVRALLMPKQDRIEDSVAWVEQDLLDRGYVEPGSMILITGGMPIPGPTKTNFIKLHVVAGSDT